MRSAQDKGFCDYGSMSDNLSNNASSFDFHKGNVTNRGSSHHCTVLGSLAKPAPSKWDDAQKWLVGLSNGGDQSNTKAKPRNSNAEDKKMGFPTTQKAKDSSRNMEGVSKDKEETKKIDCNESFWRINKPFEDSSSTMRSVCLRDMGTEMTPIASQEPSRTGTPIRATTPLTRSPISSRASTPERCHQGSQAWNEATVFGRQGETRWSTGEEDKSDAHKTFENNNYGQSRKPSSLETRALAWDEAERAKYMARFKREEVKIQAWENYQKRHAEEKMRQMEVKAERLKARAQERLTNKLASTRRKAEEKRANAEAKLNEQAVRTSERADYIRRTGHMSTSFSFKLPSICW